MSDTDKLSVEQIEHYTKESNYTPTKPMRMMARQLLDTMRENERLRLQLEKDLQTMIKVDETEEYLLAREIYDIRYALSNKHSATDYRLTRGIMADCQTCKTTPCSCGYATQNPEAYKDILMLGVKPTKHPSKD